MPDDSKWSREGALQQESREDATRRAKLEAFWERAAPFRPFLDDPDVTEIAVNDPHTVWLMRGGEWESIPVPEVDLEFLDSIGSRLSNYATKSFDRKHTSLSTHLPSGERVEMTHPPSCPDNTRYLNIRKHAAAAIPHAKLIESGYYAHTRHQYSLSLSDAEREKIAKQLSDTELELWELATKGDFATFVERAVQAYQNIVISGATGTGKTSYTRAMIELIDPRDRIVTVEDSHEMPLPNHPNHNHLFYKKNEGDDGALAAELLHSSMRKTPTRIIMAELRGAEAMTYLSDVITSGHPGGITTTHSGSPKEALLRLAYLVRKAPEGQSLPMEAVLQFLYTSLNVVIQLNKDRVKGRHVPSIYYDPMYARSLLG